MSEQTVAYMLMFGCMVVGFGIMGLMILSFIYHYYPKTWQKIRKGLHKHHWGPQEWISDVPSVDGGLTGFSVSICGIKGCGCVSVTPLDNLTKIATPEFRVKFMADLLRRGQKLAD